VATLRAQPAVGHGCPLHDKVIFSWDGTVVGERKVGDGCAASLLFTPPVGHRDTGPHTVTASIDGRTAPPRADYTIDPAADPNPNPNPVPNPRPTPSPDPTSQPTSTSGASTPGGTRSTPMPDAITSTDETTAPDASQSAPAVAAATDGAPGNRLPSIGHWMTWTLIGGASLMLAGAAVGLLFLISRRRGSDNADADTGVQEVLPGGLGSRLQALPPLDGPSSEG
jgi:hypothetical protein